MDWKNRVMLNELKQSVIYLEYALLPYISFIINVHNILFWKNKLFSILALLSFYGIWYCESEISFLFICFGVYIFYKSIKTTPPMPKTLKDTQTQVEKWIIDTLIEDEKDKKGKEVTDSITLLQLTLKQCYEKTEQIKYFTSFIIPLIFPVVLIFETRILSYSLIIFVFSMSFVGVIKDRKKLLFGFENIKNAVIIKSEEEEEDEHSDSSDEDSEVAPHSPLANKKVFARDILDNAVKDGYLLKRGEINQNWQRRYFILTKDLLLFYFKKENERSAGVINCQFSRLKLGEVSLFAIKDRSRGREFILQAENDDDRESWVSALHQTMLSKKK